MSSRAPREDFSDAGIEVSAPKDYAAGLGGVLHSMEPAIKQMGLARTVKLMTKINHKEGFDCMSCAWPDPDHRKLAEFCENGAKAVTWEATPLKIPRAFWAENSLTSLADKTEYWLGMQGRITEPVYKPAGSDRYEPIDWESAFRIIAERLNGLDHPDEAAFYTSGRASNEAAVRPKVSPGRAPAGAAAASRAPAPRVAAPAPWRRRVRRQAARASRARRRAGAVA